VINAATTILVAEICRRLFGDGEFVRLVCDGYGLVLYLIFAEILPKVFGARFCRTYRAGSSLCSSR